MKTFMMAVKIMMIVPVLYLAACGKSQQAPITSVPQGVQATGEQMYGHFCAKCHGPQGTGSNQGPPLVHKIYEPSHHSDMSFYRAALQGVHQHHWNFGNMPPVPGIKREQVSLIVAYVRGLQVQAGIQ